MQLFHCKFKSSYFLSKLQWLFSSNFENLFHLKQNKHSALKIIHNVTATSNTDLSFVFNCKLEQIWSLKML